MPMRGEPEPTIPGWIRNIWAKEAGTAKSRSTSAGSSPPKSVASASSVRHKLSGQELFNSSPSNLCDEAQAPNEPEPELECHLVCRSLLNELWEPREERFQTMRGMPEPKVLVVAACPSACASARQPASHVRAGAVPPPPPLPPVFSCAAVERLQPEAPPLPPFVPPPPAVAPRAMGPGALTQEFLCGPPSKPALGSSELPSTGSLWHGSGNCKPCAFVHAKGCEKGVACNFCHLCSAVERRRRKKERKGAHSLHMQ